MIKDFFKKVKIFLYGLITGIITAIMSYLYIKNQKVIKKIIRIKKNENNIYLQSSNKRQGFERKNFEEWRQIRQSNRALGERKSIMEGRLQCGQHKQYEAQSGDKERELLGDGGIAQGEIRGDNVNKHLPNKRKLEKPNRNRKDIKHNTSQPKMEDKEGKVYKHS